MEEKLMEDAVAVTYADSVDTSVSKNTNRFSYKTYLFFKRAIDIVGAFLGLIILSPLFLIVSMIIKFSDGGNVFYAHKRVGYHGKDLYLYKFRSMKVNADDLKSMLTQEQLEMYKNEYKIVDDPRITKVGKFLRKTSLDELPQLVNILKGELSIIGPRPILRDEMNLNYTKEQAKVFVSVKPGLTGYWQAYARNDASYESGQRQKMELSYIENKSILLDIKIFFKTILKVVKRSGAM